MGFAAAIPFLAVVCTTLKNGVAISMVAFMVLIPSAFLCFALRCRLGVPPWVTALLCTLVAMILCTLSTYVIRTIAPEITDSLGIYLYLMAAFSVVAAVFRGREVNSPGGAGLWALQYAGVFGLCAVLISALREVLAYGQLWGFSLGLGFTLEGAKMPFFGFILTGLLLALSQYVMRLAYIRRHMTGD